MRINEVIEVPAGEDPQPLILLDRNRVILGLMPPPNGPDDSYQDKAAAGAWRLALTGVLEIMEKNNIHFCAFPEPE